MKELLSLTFFPIVLAQLCTLFAQDKKSPPVETPVGKFIGYHMRRGGHGLTEYDTQAFTGFARKHFSTLTLLPHTSVHEAPKASRMMSFQRFHCPPSVHLTL